jgi:hypothetical protein
MRVRNATVYLEFAEDLPALAQPQFHRRRADLLLPGVGTLGKGSRCAATSPFCAPFA